MEAMQIKTKKKNAKNTFTKLAPKNSNQEIQKIACLSKKSKKINLHT
mgnify:CR=1 FL=1